jgi:DNA polymerase IIIc chi subunit
MVYSKELKVVFFQVKEPVQKLDVIAKIASYHFHKNETFLIFVENEKGAQFVDDLLWKHPPHSFLPHIISQESTSEKVVITHIKNNLNQASALFNLCSTPLFIEGTFHTIYEFEDLSTPHKANLSTLRFNAYKEAKLSISHHLFQESN